MTTPSVWIDHHVARIISLVGDAHHLATVEPPVSTRRIHQKRGVVGSGHRPTDPHYLDLVATALRGAERILVSGPGSAKDELVSHLHAHHPHVARRVVAVDPQDHPTDGQLIAYARERFVALDPPPRSAAATGVEGVDRSR